MKSPFDRALAAKKRFLTARAEYEQAVIARNDVLSKLQEFEDDCYHARIGMEDAMDDWFIHASGGEEGADAH